MSVEVSGEVRRVCVEVSGDSSRNQTLTRKVGCERCVGSSEIVVAVNQLICARSIP